MPVRGQPVGRVAGAFIGQVLQTMKNHGFVGLEAEFSDFVDDFVDDFMDDYGSL